MPGDPVSSMLGGHAPEKVIEQKKEELGLNKPLIVQYGSYLWQICRLDLGNSMIFKQRVTDTIRDKLPATIELTFFGMLITLLVGVPLGAYAADKRRSARDYYHPFIRYRDLLYPGLLAGVDAADDIRHLAGYFSDCRQNRCPGICGRL